MRTHFKPAFWDLLANHNGNFIEALRLPPLQRAYYNKLLGRGGEQALLDAPRIKVGTIHSAKGLEADFVVLRPEMAGRAYAEWLRAPEGERRCWYVGITRAKRGLWLLEPEGMRAIDWRLEL
jgi:superfamily I DNA/RNA helicase